MSFKKLRFRSKLFIGFVFVISFSLIISIIALFQLKKIERNTELIYKHPLVVSNAVRDINSCILGMHRSMKDVVLAHNKKEIEDAVQVVNRLNQEALAAFKIVDNQFLGDVKDVRDAYQYFIDWEDIRKEVIRLKQEGKAAEAEKITKGKGANHVSSLLEKTRIMTEFAKDKADEFKAESERTYHRTMNAFILILMIVIVCSVLIALLISKSILTPIHGFINATRELYQKGGDTSQDIWYTSEADLLSVITAELKNAYVQVEEANHEYQVLNEDLEDKVKERTVELETKQLQLKEKNEEYASINEEYASINEELRLANEELQKEKKISENNELIAKEKTEEFEAINEELRQTIEDLDVARQKAEENDQLKSSFLANMSHEIRTPMNGIVGFAKLLRKQDISEENLKHYVKIIIDSSNQLLRIVNDILDISKLETGQVEIFYEEVNLSMVMDDVVSFFQLRANEKNIDLQVNMALSNEENIVKTDRSKLMQILFNLVSNAIKFTEEGFIKLTCKRVNNQLQFTVQDTGIGIPKEDHHKIFDRFTKIETTTKLYGGTGLGLSICKGYVEVLGGSIDFKSGLQEGTTFYFTIPYKKVESTHQESIKEKRKEKEFHHATILVVEDEESNYQYVEELLSSRRINYMRAKTGEEALQLFNEHPDFELILMDIRLPKMDGYSATKEIRKKNSKIPIIAQTAYALSGDRERAIKAGCDDYIAKPIVEEQLVELLEKYLD